MVDWAIVSGVGSDCGDYDYEVHDPAGHCGPTFSAAASAQTARAVQVFKALGERTRSLAPVCPYCGEQSRLTTGKEIYPKRPHLHRKDFYLCAPCDAYVGCHVNTIKPLGSPANAELRAARSAAHRAFDVKWQSGAMSRTQAYRWLAGQLRMHPDQCHIGMFDVETCRRVVALCDGDDFEVQADA